MVLACGRWAIIIKSFFVRDPNWLRKRYTSSISQFIHVNDQLEVQPRPVDSIIRAWIIMLWDLKGAHFGDDLFYLCKKLVFSKFHTWSCLSVCSSSSTLPWSLHQQKLLSIRQIIYFQPQNLEEEKVGIMFGRPPTPWPYMAAAAQILSILACPRPSNDRILH